MSCRVKFCPYCGRNLLNGQTAGAIPYGFRCGNCGETIELPAYRSPALLVLTYLVAQDRLLLMRRGADPYQGKWAPPGGFVGHGESVEHAAVREMREEVRINLESRQLMPYGVASIPAINQVYHIFAVSLPAVLQATAVPPEATDVGWFSQQELSRLDLWDPAAKVDHASLFAGARSGHFNFYQETDEFSRLIRQHGDSHYLS